MMDRSVKLPNFLIIGAHKAGTTSLYYYLRSHPQVFMPSLKEARFFAYDDSNPDHRSKVPKVFPITSFEQYAELFSSSENELAIGEASPEYLNSSFAARRIRELLPEVKLIASLRNPIDRAYSLHQMSVRAGHQDKASLDNFEMTKEAAVVGSYYPKVKTYIDLFGKKNLKIIIFEEFAKDAIGNVKNICNFLDIDPTVPAEQMVHHNHGGVPKSKIVHRLSANKTINKLIKPYLPQSVYRGMNKIKNMNLSKAPPISPEQRKRGISLIRDDVSRLEDLIDRDLSHWLSI